MIEIISAMKAEGTIILGMYKQTLGERQKKREKKEKKEREEEEKKKKKLLVPGRDVNDPSLSFSNHLRYY